VPAEPLIVWSDPPLELFGFIAAFLTAGAVGFRLSALRGLHGSPVGDERDFARAAARRAALLGLLGAAIGAVLLAQRLPVFAARRHMTVAAFVATQPPVALQIILLVLSIAGFALAASGRGPGWAIAAFGVLVSPVRAAFFGQLERIVNPVHELAAGLWIGTLFMLIAVGIAPALRAPLSAERRGALAARLVNGFSPLALGSAALLATFGVITAWRHLKKIEALWTTPYGYTLIAKLCVVACVLAFGAWNWRRQKPRLGSEAGAIALRRSATAELALAGVVLLITSVLVSLPAPE
jgi:putative copper export protein